jgi:Flp pilus assembly pilin Flp
MRRILNQFWREDDGQDLIEYTLLLAFVCLIAAVIFVSAGQQAAGIWRVANSQLVNANSSAS